MRNTGILLLSLALLLAPGAMMSGMASPADELVNTGVPGRYPSVSGNVIAFTPSNYYSEVWYYDTATGNALNTGQVAFDPVSVSGGIIAFWIAEWYLVQDLNGDGDTNDKVLSYYDISTGSVTHAPTQPGGDTPAFSGSIIAYHTPEYLVGGDVNGDGDTSDQVIMYYDISTDTLTNTGVIGYWPAVSGSIIAFQTGELFSAQDLNGDGDLWDWVVRYYDISAGTVASTGGQVVNWAERNAVSGSIIALSTREVWTGDLNGDGDIADNVIMYYDISTGTLTNTGVVGFFPAVSGNIIAFTSSEEQIGEDLNGDGDTEDWLLRYYDISTGAVASLGVAGGWPVVSGNIIAFQTYEGQIGEDLNGDGDEIDYVIRYFNIPEAPTTPTIGAISEQIDSFLVDGSIDNEGLAEALRAFLEQAGAMLETGNRIAAENILNAFINSVEAQSRSGRHISTEAAQALIDSAQAVIDGS